MAITSKDLKTLASVTKVVLEELIEEKELVTKEDLKYLPSKEEYFEREDKAMSKLKKIEEELSLISDHSSNHSDRIEKLEKIHPQSKHLAAI